MKQNPCRKIRSIGRIIEFRRIRSRDCGRLHFEFHARRSWNNWPRQTLATRGLKSKLQGRGPRGHVRQAESARFNDRSIDRSSPAQTRNSKRLSLNGERDTFRTNRGAKK